MRILLFFSLFWFVSCESPKPAEQVVADAYANTQEDESVENGMKRIYNETSEVLKENLNPQALKETGKAVLQYGSEKWQQTKELASDLAKNSQQHLEYLGGKIEQGLEKTKVVLDTAWRKSKETVNQWIESIQSSF